MARTSDGNHAPKLNDLTPRNDELVRGGDGEEERKRKGVNLGMISIVKSYDKASPVL